MDSLHSLVYVSTAKRVFSQADLDALLLEARRSNALSGLTGILLHCGGNFMQMLEGPRGALMDTFERIKRSRRHDSIIELMNEPAAAREFPDWSMTFSQATAPQFLALRTANWRTPPSGAPDGLSTGKELLGLFWRETRR